MERQKHTSHSNSSDSDDDDNWADAHEDIEQQPEHDDVAGRRSSAGQPSVPDIRPETPVLEPGLVDPEDDEPEGQDEEDPKFTDDEIRDLLRRGTALKDQGNDAFRALKWDEAIAHYKEALRTIPRRENSGPPAVESEVDKEKGKETATSQNDAEDQSPTELDSTPMPSAAPAVAVGDPLKDMTELQRECAMARSVVNGNIAACLVKQDQHEEAVKFCTESLNDVPNYFKALQRRAASNEVLGTWSSLAAAEKDYTLLAEILPPTNSLRPQVLRSVKTIRPRVEAAQKKETDEMLGKLKDLGNSVLGKFGLSTNNFQFTPNGSGGYSMNFAR